MNWDKRRNKRKRIDNLYAACFVGSDYFIALVRNISRKGICLAAQPGFKPGEKMNMALRLSSNQPALRNVEGEVRWTTEDGYYGLKYEDITPESQKIIDDFMNARNN